ncbi:MAG: amino acid ABC transporter substrate-binding protein [Betaproteobacteria bacterium]|nr:amino acid ABC transporter substrate-binding protein [Betaproteobacteria bacterium]
MRGDTGVSDSGHAVGGCRWISRADGLRWLAPLLVGAVLIGCQVEKEPIRIGFLGGLSGRLSDLGEAGRNGVQFAVDEANEAGGIKGQRIELLVRDDAQDPQKANAALDELIAARVELVIGPMTSAMAEVVAPAAQRAGLILISPTVTARKFYDLDDGFFLMMASAYAEARLSAEYHFGEGRARRVAVIHDTRNRAYTESWLAEFTSAFQQLGGEVSPHPIESGSDVDLDTPVRQALARRPDVVLMIAAAVDTARLAQKVRERDDKVTLAASQWATTERLIELGGRHVEGLISHNYFDRRSTTEEMRKLRSAYVERFRREPGFAGVAAYDAARVAFAALERRAAGQNLRASLLANGPFPGADGNITFNRSGDSDRVPRVTVVREGQFVTLR